MKGKILLPPDIVEIGAPLIFLAGPIQGAADWQGDAIRIIRSIDDGVNIASPRREYIDGDFSFEAQVDWETRYLNEAGRKGLILFWLAKEFAHDFKRAHAQTTRFELAEWKMRHERDGVKLVIGVEDGFTGAKYIKRRFSLDCPDVLILDSLQETCKKAVQLLKI